MSVTHTHLSTLIDENRISVSLVDASGVLYNDEGTIPTAPDAIRKLQSIGPVILVTNNSYMAPDFIHDYLLAQDIHIPESHIFSSGYGLSHDENMRSLIENKQVFHFGQDRSAPYIHFANPKGFAKTPEDADVVVLTSTLPGDINDHYREQVIQAKINNPELPIICCNPDLYIRGLNDSLYSVIGLEGHLIEKATGQSIHWVGKPEKKFSMILKTWLKDTHNLDVDKGLHFFDDNIHNIRSLQDHLGVTGCCITDTGLYPIDNHGPFIAVNPHIAPDHFVPRLAL